MPKEFLKKFIFSIVIVTAMLITGVSAYKLTARIFDLQKPQAITPPVSNTPKQKEIVEEKVSIDTVSKNLIFSLNTESEITAILLEIFDGFRSKLTYITIPVDSSITLSSDMYKKMITYSPTLPQIMRLSNLNQYFEEEHWAYYASLLFEDIIGEKVSYYTVIQEDVFHEWFQDKEVTQGTGIEIVYELNASFLESIKAIDTVKELEELMEECYQKIRSNLKEEEKEMYLESYCNLHQRDISYKLIEGNRKERFYHIEKALLLY